MTQKAGTSPDGGAARLLIAIPLGAVIALAIASMRRGSRKDGGTP